MGKPFRVLCLDGGGMRGLYSAVLLDTLIKRIHPHSDNVDAGKAFDLIVGTSTGGILAVGLAYGMTLQGIIDLYTEKGKEIFPSPVPRNKLGLISWMPQRPESIKSGQTALINALEEQFQNTTIKQLYDKRGIALCLPAVRMATRKAWVFKTPHIPARNGHHAKNRDNDYKLTDVCLATSAAPILLPLVAIDNPDDKSRYDVFTDGGLWANNPTLIGLIEALEITESKSDIQIISVSTASPPTGKVISKDATNPGILDLKVGIAPLETSLDAQASGIQYMTMFLKKHLKANVEILRLAHDAPSDEQAKYIGLDRADEKAITALTDMAKSDAENIISVDSKHSEEEVKLLQEIIKSMPEMVGKFQDLT